MFLRRHASHVRQAIIGISHRVDVVDRIDQRRINPREGTEDNATINH